MKITENNIKIEEVSIVRSKCPLSTTVYDRDFEFKDRCEKCLFSITKLKCGWINYETELSKSFTECEEDDGSGGMPFDDYYKFIKCYKCNNEIKHHSGMSWFNFTDELKCNKCGTIHLYLKGNPLTFAVPIEDYNNKRIDSMKIR